MVVGLRVIRGPNWPHRDEDGGKSHAGTIVSVVNSGNVVVQWDMGKRTTCRVGEHGKHDVIVLDSRPAGVTHPNVECVGCENGVLQGTRWKCNECKNGNLCTPCYYDDKHLTNHNFSRIDYPEAKPVSMPKRSVSQRARALGVYTHAVVNRGPDWAYADQDGGSGEKGDVEETFLTGKGGATKLSVRVKWRSGTVGTYRLGKGGKVDLTCEEEGAGTEYYPDHLAFVDVEGLTKTLQAQLSPKTGPVASFAVGDRVCVAVSMAELKQLCGGRRFTRQLVTGAMGVVKWVAANGDVVVDIEGRAYTIAPAALKKVSAFKTGDLVRIVGSKDNVKMLQSTRGSWTASMSKTVGQEGKVIMVDKDGDVVVNFSGTKHVIHPACLEPASIDSKGTSQAHVDTTKPEPKVERLTLPIRKIPAPLKRPAPPKLPAPPKPSTSSKPPAPPKPSASSKPQGAEGGRSSFERSRQMTLEELPKCDDLYHKYSAKAFAPKPGTVPGFDGQAMLRALNQGSQNAKKNCFKAVINGDDAMVRPYLAWDKSLASKSKKHMPCLSIASFMGHTEVVASLLSAGADVNGKDGNGNTALLVAISEQKENVTKLLIDKGANVNLAGKARVTPLHLTVHKNMINHLKLLLRNGADPNVQDDDGDTPLHDAIFIKNETAAEILIDEPRVNVKMTNEKGFTTLDLACMKGFSRAVKKLLNREPSLSNMRSNNDGLYPLHICAVNNHVEEAKLLFLKGKPVVDGKNNKNLTPLHLATLCTHESMVSLLLMHNADVNAKNAVGDTPMHLLLKGRRNKWGAPMMQGDQKVNEKVQIAKLLIDKGANVDAPNDAGLTPITSCDNMTLKLAVQKYAKQHSIRNQTTQVRPSTASAGTATSVNHTQKCFSCSEKFADSCFLPCQHQYACLNCAENYKRCPVCRKDVARIIDLRLNRVHEEVVSKKRKVE